MEYNLPSELVKNLDFGDEAKQRVIAGVNKLAQAVKSTLGASGKCVVYEDGNLIRVRGYATGENKAATKAEKQRLKEEAKANRKQNRQNRRNKA